MSHTPRDLSPLAPNVVRLVNADQLEGSHHEILVYPIEIVVKLVNADQALGNDPYTPELKTILIDVRPVSWLRLVELTHPISPLRLFLEKLIADTLPLVTVIPDH